MASSARRVENPKSAWSWFDTLCARSAAATRSTHAIAICATTSTVRDREAVRSVMSPAAPRSDAASGGRTARNAGRMPTSTAEIPDSASAKVQTRSPGDTSSAAACSGGKNDGRTSAVHAAKIIASAVEANARTAVSVSSCRISRAPLAPSARRTAISLARVVVRDSSRLATLAQASSSTSPTPPIRTLATMATCARCSGTIRVAGVSSNGRGSFGRSSVPRLLAGYSRASRVREGRQLRAGFRQRHAVAQLAEDGQAAIAAAALCRGTERRPHFDRSARHRCR